MKRCVIFAMLMCGVISCSAPNRVNILHPGIPTSMPALAVPEPPIAEEWFTSGITEPYRIQVGDVLSVRFFYENRLDDMVRVRPDGRISITPVDDVPAAGLTPHELDQALTERFAKFINKPDLSVIVREFEAQRAYVGGEVARPGVVELTAKTSMLSAIIAAGGPMTTAALENVVLIRRGEGNACYVIKLNTNDIIRKGVGDVLLHPYDIVYVPRTIITDVGIFVEQYINRITPRFMGFQFLYTINPEVQVATDRGTNLLFQRLR